MVRNPPAYEDADIQEATTPRGGFFIISFSRKALGQTGDGHYSPIAAYHEPTDQCLVMDVARFKYAPFWVSVQELYEATRPHDAVTKKSRGWVLIYPNHGLDEHKYPGTKTVDDRKKPFDLVPTLDEVNSCPLGQRTKEIFAVDHSCCNKSEMVTM
jgi:hypothetical protein